jgi:hypothetical protein
LLGAAKERPFSAEMAAKHRSLLWTDFIAPELTLHTN